ncbi:MAG: hypothetical protein R3E96_04155, partial [Planctomycetota bacterium]
MLFSSPVDINTVTSSTFRVSNVDSGTTPAGEYFLDPNDPRRVIFRPALSFDANGTPTFGFEADTPYQITIPGELHSANGPYIRSTLGRPNQARLECTILTNDQVTDPVPGPPVVEVYADTVDTSVTPSTIDRVANILGVFDGVGTDGLADNLASGSTQLLNVYRQGKIYILFKDIMNPATLANPLNQTSPFVTVRYDEDGNLTTTADRSGPVAGTWNVSVNTELLQTVLTFQPSASLLSAGSGGFTDPRLTVVDVPTSCVDLLLNPALPENGGGLTAMVTELGVTQAITLPLTGGGFGDTTLRDERRTSGDWGTNSRLAPGLGGGSGRLGELVVFPGETVVLNTDSQTFPLGGSLDVLGNADISGNYPATITVTDGVFEFSYLYVQPGGTLRLEGSNPARILVRGIAEVAAGSVVDLSGAGAAAHDSTVLQPQVTTPTNSTNPAAGGARGGVGADRWDFDATTMALWIPIGGVDIPDGVTVVNNGTDGGGIGNTTLGEGKGGPRLMDFPTVNNLV